MILLIDNYDSFSYNLFQLVGTINDDIKIIRNDEMTVDEIKELAPRHIILSPGPKRPKDAGVCIDVVKKLGSEMKILGVCLGHQSIYDAKLIIHQSFLKDWEIQLMWQGIIHFRQMKAHCPIA